MGKCTVLAPVSGIPGRFRIALDFGDEVKQANLTALTAAIAREDVNIAAQQVKLAEAEALEAEQRQKIIDATDALIYAPEAQKPEKQALLSAEIRAMSQLLASNQPVRLALERLKAKRDSYVRLYAYWQGVDLTSEREAWCADYTEEVVNAEPGTIEIDGEPDLVLIRPGLATWNEGIYNTGFDGEVRGREVMSPAQAFFNAAILPGWQRYKPTYRWGTLTSVNKEAHTCSVTLADAKSSAQDLPINKRSTLTGVPIMYMECDSEPFEVGDRVVVQFVNQDWNQPLVIGFLDNPKACGLWCLYVYATPVTPGAPLPRSNYQRIPKGGDGYEVTGEYPTLSEIWTGWSDGVFTIARTDIEVTEAFTVTSRTSVLGNESGLNGFVLHPTILEDPNDPPEIEFTGWASVDIIPAATDGGSGSISTLAVTCTSATIGERRAGHDPAAFSPLVFSATMPLTSASTTITYTFQSETNSWTCTDITNRWWVGP